MKKLSFYTCILFAFLLTGCVTNLTSTLAPGAELTDLGTIAVVRFEPDKRNLNTIIADQLTLRGYSATAVEEDAVPEGTDTLVTYVDNWQWDITNYMIRINIQFRDGESQSLIVNGESFRTSLVRKTPQEMIIETLDEILKNKTG